MLRGLLRKARRPLIVTVNEATQHNFREHKSMSYDPSTKAIIRAAIAHALREGVEHHIEKADVATTDDERDAHLADAARFQTILDRGATSSLMR